MMAVGIILIVIATFAAIILFFAITPKAVTKKLQLTADSSENGVILPKNIYTQKVISFYTLADDSLKITFFAHITYADFTVITWNQNGGLEMKRYAASPSDENTIQIPFKKRQDNIAIFVHKYNNEPYSPSFPKVIYSRAQIRLIALFSAIIAFVFGVGTDLIGRVVFESEQPHIIAFVYIATSIISIATFFIVTVFLNRKYRLFEKGGYLDD